MAVNGTKIAVGQRWKTRGGQEVEIVSYDDETATPFVWDLSDRSYVTNEGRQWDIEDEIDNGDLITLIQDEHGFIPWNGGECPVKRSTLVEVKFRDGNFEEDFGNNFDWRSTSAGWNIIAYRVVKQTEQSKEIVVETKTETKEEPKYTVEQVFFAINEATADSVAYTNTNKVKSYLAKTQDPDYKLYMELKAKFE